MNNYASYIDINSEVLKALQFDIPIIAFPSSIFNELDLISKIESIVGENNVVCAFIAIIDGRIKIGLNKDELDFLLCEKNLIHIERKDIPYMIALEKSGKVALSAAMIFSEIAGIKVLACDTISTIGQNNPNNLESLLDISEMEKSNVCVVCSDFTSSVGIDFTSQGLNVAGIPVISYKNSNHLEVTSPCECAKMMKIKWDLDLAGSILITNSNYGIESIIFNSALAAKIAVEYNKIKNDY